MINNEDKWYEKLDDWMYDYVPGYAQLWRLWKNYLCPFQIKRRVKFFFQRRFRGFDDSETWSLDWTFYKWLYPRLKRFAEITCAYPGNDEYPTCESWQEELNKRAEQVKHLVDQDDMDFNDWSYIPKKELEELKKKRPNDTTYINMTAYDYMAKDFHKWFAEHCGWLWW